MKEQSKQGFIDANRTMETKVKLTEQKLEKRIESLENKFKALDNEQRQQALKIKRNSDFTKNRHEKL